MFTFSLIVWVIVLIAISGVAFAGRLVQRRFTARVFAFFTQHRLPVGCVRYVDVWGHLSSIGAGREVASETVEGAHASSRVFDNTKEYFLVDRVPTAGSASYSYVYGEFYPEGVDITGLGGDLGRYGVGAYLDDSQGSDRKLSAVCVEKRVCPEG